MAGAQAEHCLSAHHRKQANKRLSRIRHSISDGVNTLPWDTYDDMIGSLLSAYSCAKPDQASNLLGRADIEAKIGPKGR